MDTNYLQKTMIFRGMNETEIIDTLTALSSYEKNYQKNSAVFHAGKTTEYMGVVLEGSVTIESNDAWGNRTILSHIEKDQFFAETYALLEKEPMLMDVIANEDCRILFLRIGSLRQLMSNKNIWATKIISNLLMISVHKNLTLSERNFHTSPKTIRGRVMAYLSSVSLQKGYKEFDIPFNRQQLADYLNLERSALSKELGKMQREGIIFVEKNHFIIYSLYNSQKE